MGIKPSGQSKVRIRAQFHWGPTLPAMGWALVSLVPCAFGIYLMSSPKFFWGGIALSALSLLCGAGPFIYKSFELQSRQCWATENAIHFQSGFILKMRVHLSLDQIENIRFARAKYGGTVTIVANGKDQLVLDSISHPAQFIAELEKLIQRSRVGSRRSA